MRIEDTFKLTAFVNGIGEMINKLLDINGFKHFFSEMKKEVKTSKFSKFKIFEIRTG